MARTRKDAPQTVTAAPTFDFAAAAGNVRESAPTAGGGRFVNNPFVPVLRESFIADDAGENGWREVPVPGYHVRDMVSALRNATQQLAEEGIGVRIRYAYSDDGEPVKEHGDVKRVPEDDREVLVKFLGRPRKEYDKENGENGNGSDVDGGDDDTPDE